MKATIMLMITLVSWAGALLVAKFLRVTIIKGESTPFVMELPPYRLPTFKGLAIHTWERTWQYIKKAGTVILGISIILWAMMTFPGLPDSRVQEFENMRETVKMSAEATVIQNLVTIGESTKLSKKVEDLQNQLIVIDRKEAEEGLRNSVAGRMGLALEGVSKWAGFDWRTNIALVGGFAAKEVVVSALGTAYSLGEVDPEETGSLSETLAKTPGWSPPGRVESDHLYYILRALFYYRGYDRKRIRFMEMGAFLNGVQYCPGPCIGYACFSNRLYHGNIRELIYGCVNCCRYCGAGCWVPDQNLLRKMEEGG